MSSENSAYSGVAAVDIPQLVELLHALDANCWDEIPPSIVESLTGLAGLKRLVAGLTIVLIDHGGTDPKNTSDVIADLAPDLFEEFGESFVTALCQEVQESELPKQSALYQRMFDRFNAEYFEGRLPDYRIRVVYDVWYWETHYCSDRPLVPWPMYEATGFIDFGGRQILVRFLAQSSLGSRMAASLLHEMAHAGTDGGHGENWKSEMARLKQLGAPVDNLDLGPKVR